MITHPFRNGNLKPSKTVIGLLGYVCISMYTWKKCAFNHICIFLRINMIAIYSSRLATPTRTWLSRATTQPASLGTWSLPKAPGKGKMPMNDESYLQRKRQNKVGCILAVRKKPKWSIWSSTPPPVTIKKHHIHIHLLSLPYSHPYHNFYHWNWYLQELWT